MGPHLNGTKIALADMWYQVTLLVGTNFLTSLKTLISSAITLSGTTLFSMFVICSLIVLSVKSSDLPRWEMPFNVLQKDR